MLTELINNPHQIDKQTLYELRELVAQYPYYHAARMMLLKNLYLLHDTSFDDELRRAAFYLPDRRKPFELVEGRHFSNKRKPQTEESRQTAAGGSRTASLIDRFLDQIPEESSTEKKQKPLPWYANNDYMQLLIDTDQAEQTATPTTQQSRQDSIIDNFLSQGGRMTLSEITAEEEKAIVDAIQLSTQQDDFIAPKPTTQGKTKSAEKDAITEDLAQKYIKQGNYLRAKEIITQLNLDNSEKTFYFADQIRFLDKLIRLTSGA